MLADRECLRLVEPLLAIRAGLADPKAVSIAVAALDAVQSIGMPEADCIIAQTAVYLARAPKSQEVRQWWFFTFLPRQR